MLSLQHECYLGFLEISAKRSKTVAESRTIIYPKKIYVEFSCEYSETPLYPTHFKNRVILLK